MRLVCRRMAMGDFLVDVLIAALACRTRLVNIVPIGGVCTPSLGMMGMADHRTRPMRRGDTCRPVGQKHHAHHHQSE